MRVRTMKNNDYNAVYNLWINTKGMGLNTIDDSKEGIEVYLKRNPTTCFVVEKDNEIIGVIISGHDGRRGFIYHMAVKEEERNQGIGNILLDSALQALKKEKITKVALVVFEKNIIGNEFWEKRGFSIRHDLLYRNKSIYEVERMDT